MFHALGPSSAVDRCRGSHSVGVACVARIDVVASSGRAPIDILALWHLAAGWRGGKAFLVAVSSSTACVVVHQRGSFDCEESPPGKSTWAPLLWVSEPSAQNALEIAVRMATSGDRAGPSRRAASSQRRSLRVMSHVPLVVEALLRVS